MLFNDKIIGDILHYLIGYTGDAEIFDIFRRYTVGDIMIERDTKRRYNLENLLSKVSRSIKRFNELGINPFKVLMAKHAREASTLYHIDIDGRSDEIADYKAIGSGSIIADKFCGKLSHNQITMKDLTKHAYLAINFMDQYCPALGVGVDSGGVPNIKYLYYDRESDKDAAKDMPQDIDEYKKYADYKLQKIIQSLDSILKK